VAVLRKRTFGGRGGFTLVGWEKHKHAAKQAAYNLRRSGYLARVVRDKKYLAWQVWCGPKRKTRVH